MDLMHQDFGGAHGVPMGAGSWKGGVDKQWGKTWGVTDSRGMGDNYKSGAGAPSVKHEAAESPHATPTYTDSPDPRTERPGAAGGPDMKSRINQHREFRKEVEKPMKVSVQHPPARAVKQVADRQHQRFASQQEHRQARHINRSINIPTFFS
jgi:hypothetical protein